jgi:hypothetical protein
MPKQRPDDTDLPGEITFLDDDELAAMPVSEDPGEPTAEQLTELARQVDDEKVHGHPAHKVVVGDDDD